MHYHAQGASNKSIKSLINSFLLILYLALICVLRKSYQIRRRLCTKEAQVKLKTELRLVDWSLLEGIHDVSMIVSVIL